MWLKIWSKLTIFTVFTVLIYESRTATVPAPSNLTITCDSFGVMVTWNSYGLSPQAEFWLELQDHKNSDKMSIKTTHHHYNISDYLKDTSYNHYFVKVKAQDGENQSEFEESAIFSFNKHQKATHICGLDFPKVNLIPKNNTLILKFTNPLRLYRDTPALRNLSTKELLQYTVKLGQGNEERFNCNHSSDTCETAVTFSKEQEEYCVSLVGEIRQTPIKQTSVVCYRGTLDPGPPFTVFLIPVLIAVVVVCLLISLMVLLGRKIIWIIREQNLSKIPEFLQNKLKHSPIQPLTTLREPVVENPRVLWKSSLSLNSELPESTTLLGNSSSGLPDKQEHVGSLESTGSEETSCQSAADPYGKAVDLSSGLDSTGYDRPHGLVEMSPEDMVEGYGCRSGLFA